MMMTMLYMFVMTSNNMMLASCQASGSGILITVRLYGGLDSVTATLVFWG
jgi:hypothetical protein